MSDDLGLSAGAKGISEGIKTGREAGREIGKNIEEVQKEAVDVARQRAQAKIRERREAELKKERAIYKALEQYKHEKKISDEEYKLRIDFIKQYGTKEWQKLIDIKTQIEKLEKADEKDLHEQVEDTDAKKVDINDPLVAMVSQAISKTKI